MAPLGFGKNGGLLIEPFYQNSGLPASSRRKQRRICRRIIDAAAEATRRPAGEWVILANSKEIRIKAMNDQWIFGLTMTIVGMGGTLLSLWLLSVLIGLLKKVFPYHKEHAHPKR